MKPDEILHLADASQPASTPATDALAAEAAQQEVAGTVPYRFDLPRRDFFKLVGGGIMVGVDVTVKVPAGYGLESPEAPGSFPMGEIGGYEASVKVGEGQLAYHRTLVFGRGGRLAYQQKVYPAVKQAFDVIHDKDQHTITLRQQAAGAKAGQ